MSLEKCQTQAATYVGSQTRDTQNNNMHYYFLIDSLDTEFQGDGVALCKPLHSYKHPNHLCFTQANYCPDKD